MKLGNDLSRVRGAFAELHEVLGPAKVVPGTLVDRHAAILRALDGVPHMIETYQKALHALRRD
jgi:hypothetical protein